MRRPLWERRRLAGIVSKRPERRRPAGIVSGFRTKYNWFTRRETPQVVTGFGHSPLAAFWKLFSPFWFAFAIASRSSGRSTLF